MEKVNDLMELVNGCGVAIPGDAAKVPTAKETAGLLAELGFVAAALSVEKRLRPTIKKADIAAAGYIEITPAKINEFLSRKVAQYNLTAMPKGKTRRFESLSSDQFARAYTSYAESQQSMLANSSISSANFTPGQLLTVGNLYWTNAAATDVQTIGTTSAKFRADEYYSAKTVHSGSTEPNTIGHYQWVEVPVDRYAGIPPLNVLRKFKDTKATPMFDYYTVASVNTVHDPLLLGRIDDCDSRYFIAQWGTDVSLDDVI